MKEVIFRTRLFQSEAERPASEVVLRLFLEALTAANVAWLKFNPNTPPIYEAGVRYHQETPKVKGGAIPEEWLQIPYVMERGWGDCEDLACWLAAELQCKGTQAHPVFSWRTSGRYSIYHIMVKLPDGRVLDPSRRLGMGAL